MKASIIIGNHRANELFFNTIDSIVKFKENWQELIVVNNSLREKDLKKIRKKLKGKPVKIIDVEESCGPCKTRNIGVRESKGKYLVFLCSDVQVEKGWLTKVVDYMEKNKNVGGGQLKLLRIDRKKNYDSAGEKITGNGFLAERAREAEDKGQFDKDENIFSGKAAAMLVRRDVFEKIGGFDESYFYYWEEPDLFWKIWKAGYRVVFLWMGRVWHTYGSLKRNISRKRILSSTYLGCRNQLITILKNGVGWRRWWMLAWVNLSWNSLGLAFLVKLQWQSAWAVCKAYGWILLHLGVIVRKRREIKQYLGKDFYKDEIWFDKVIIKRNWSWYLGKGISYILGKPF